MLPLWINEKICKYLELERCTVIIKVGFPFNRPIGACNANYKSFSETEMITSFLWCTFFFTQAVALEQSLFLSFHQPQYSHVGNSNQPSAESKWTLKLQLISKRFTVTWFVACCKRECGNSDHSSYVIHLTTDKLFGQLKQDQTHTLAVTWVRFLALCFIVLCSSRKGKREARPFVSLCAFINVVFIWCCRVFPYFTFSWVHEHSLDHFFFLYTDYNFNCDLCPNWFRVIHRQWCCSLSVCWWGDIFSCCFYFIVYLRAKKSEKLTDTLGYAVYGAQLRNCIK